MKHKPVYAWQLPPGDERSRDDPTIGGVYAIQCVPCRYEVWKAFSAHVDQAGLVAVHRHEDAGEARPDQALGICLEGPTHEQRAATGQRHHLVIRPRLEHLGPIGEGAGGEQERGEEDR